MLKNPPFFSIIYVNYKSAHYLANALKSLVENEEEQFFEVIIVNNDKDEAGAIKRLGEEFSCHIIENTDNKGFATAVNQGVFVASGQWVGLVNPDTLWPKAQLLRLRESLKEKNGLVGLRLLNNEGLEERFGCGQRITLFQLLLNHLPAFFNKKAIGWLSGGALFFQKELWVELGGFDERYFLYYEDVDFCERAIQAGRAIEQERAFSVVHFKGKSHSSQKSQKKYYRESQAYYFQKFRPRYEQKILRLFHFFF
jgi:GT2 family glycosyltransferase